MRARKQNIEALADSESGGSGECENVSGYCVIYGTGGHDGDLIEGMRKK